MHILIPYALSFVGLPYRWNGDDPINGYDCSGLVQELLTSAGAHPRPGVDLTAQGLFDAFGREVTWNSYTPGALAFYGESVTKITHVAMLLDQYRVIEAGGGTSKTLTEADAATQNAYVKIRLLNRRKDLVAVLKPNYASIGLAR